MITDPLSSRNGSILGLFVLSSSVKGVGYFLSQSNLIRHLGNPGKLLWWHFFLDRVGLVGCAGCCLVSVDLEVLPGGCGAMRGNSNHTLAANLLVSGMAGVTPEEWRLLPGVCF